MKTRLVGPRLGTLICSTAAALGAAACSTGGPVDIGDDVGLQLSDYTAIWDGYAEAHTFDDGSDRVRMTLDANGRGSVRLGDRPLYRPPTDPDVGWPVGQPLMLGQPLVIAGIEYPVIDARVENRRIRLGFDERAPYQPWCAMQTPVLDEVNTDVPTYNCLPNWQSWHDIGTDCGLINPDTRERTAVDCGKFHLCALGFGNVCLCTASGCSAAPADPSNPGDVFDGALDPGGTELVGTLVSSGTPMTVRLTRQ